MGMKNVCFLAMVGAMVVAASLAAAKNPLAQTNLEAALAKAKTENKLLFVQYGREACGNCQALKAMIQKKQVKLADDEFIYADVNCDDPGTRQAFGSRFKVEGSTLPFVVIADPGGTQLAGRTGYANAAVFTDFIRDTKRAYEKQQKAMPMPAKPPVLAGPVPLTAPGIPADENRELRPWTSASGQQVTAALVEEHGGTVVLKKADGKRLQINAASLSAADRDYIARLREDAAKTTD